MTAAHAFEVPPDRHYDRAHHVWARRDRRTGRVRVGIDAIGLDSLGELAYVSLVAVGSAVARGEPIGSLEAAKMTTGIAAPVEGRVVARNDAALRDPRLVNADPYRAGWLVEIEPADFERDAAELVSGDDLGPWVAAEVARLQESRGR